jgi:excisionase family DNA binding protein
MDEQRTDRLLLTTTEAAHRLGIGRSKLYELLGQQRITTVKIGRAVRVPAREVERFADELIEEAVLERSA